MPELASSGNTKMSLFDILMTITPGVNVITRQMTPFFSFTLRALTVSIFHFYISRPSEFSFMGRTPFTLCCGLQNTHLHAKDDTFKSVNIDILFLHNIC